MTTREVVFIDAVRTPFGRLGGTIRDFSVPSWVELPSKGYWTKPELRRKPMLIA